MSKRALVSGSAGFVGRHMVRELVSRGYEVDGCDLAYPNGSEANQPGPGGERIVAYDARTIFDETCRADCHLVQYDLVVHCAYHVGGREAIDGVNTNFAKNVELDSSMFRWATETGQKRVLYFSSSAVYPKHLQMPCAACDDPNCQEGPGPLREDMAKPYLNGEWQPQEPDANYGFAKLVGERLAEDARRNGLAVTVVRPFSGASATQSLDYPFPSIVSRARAGDLSVWGDPMQTRDWLDVSDVVCGALAVAESGTADPVNLCSGVGTSMGELARKIFSMANPEGAIPDVVSVPGPEGVFYRVGNPDRFFKYYRPKTTLEDMIREALS